MDPQAWATEQGTKKRPSKGLRACWECKKRKTQASSGPNDPNCPYQMAGPRPENVDEENTCALHIGERLSKLEQLFDKFVCRKPSSAGESLDLSRSPTLVDSNEKISQFVGLPEFSSDTQSISSIGDGIVSCLASKLPSWNSAPTIRTLGERVDGAATTDSEPVRRSLIALLPSQHDANLIFESSNGWTILNGMYKPTINLFVDSDPASYALSMSAVAQERGTIIARTLLHLAICISALPPEFDSSRLLHLWSLDAAMNNYVNTVTSLITSSDEQMCTLHGLETLLLLAIFHQNSANLRQSWLVVRRALNLAHLMGFHRIIAQPETSTPIKAMESAKFIWRSFVDMDRYIGLHLRLPFAADDYPVPENAEPQTAHRSKMATLCRQIADLDREVTPQTYVEALKIDEKLESMMKELSKEFWEVPNVPPTAKTPESAEVLDRLIVQVWTFELKVFIHLPYMLRAPRDNRYEYSKITALQASRNIVMRWFALRNAGITQACCRFAELSVFVAAVTLTLDILIDMGTKEKSEVQKTKGSDFAMICRVIGEMEKLAKASPREKIAARSAVVIKKLLSSLDPSKREAGKTRLTMPYFGTVELDFRKAPLRPPFDLDSDTGQKLNTVPTGQHPPVFSFVSNALWPPSEKAWERDLDFDIVLFDGLEDRDTEGNWVF
ncbi:hypothetical protein BS50DRAFT_569220 [Corynespora cassiicola Philippines]|uniref:Xylanolytic transcriptional activator regulatory domain-containing protein n=1 Tax=Corynespora cassiicola Philippines TaxID=1448308 RepID=A0A2T2P7V0_CORCC|nr:hypothetical protein BS50DRAFT_569220 [Corynespora cassiicola Philippines]